VLRTPLLSDAGRISLLAGDFDVASMTGTIPHPYSEQMAAEWIGSALAGEEGVVFAIMRSGALILHAFEAGGFDYLTVGHFSDNPASARIIAKFGFAPLGRELRDCAARGARAHCLTYRLDRAAALAGFYKT
jgi:hypothetical protein